MTIETSNVAISNEHDVLATVAAAAASATTEHGAEERDTTDQPGQHSHARGDRHDGYVAVRHVTEFVGQYRLELFVVEARHDAPRGTDHGVFGVASGGEGVGHIHLGDTDARLLHIGEQAQTVDDLVKTRLLLGCDLVRVHREHGDLVREVVLREDQRTGNDDDQDRARRRGSTGPRR